MKILILATYSDRYNEQRLVESGEKRGHVIEIVNYAKLYCNIEKNRPRVFFGDKALGKVDAIIPRISIFNQQYGSAIVRQFEMMGVFTTTGSLAFLRARDKLRSLQLMTKYQIPIPRTSFARRISNPETLIEQVGGAPLIIKVMTGSYGNGVILAESKQNAKGVIQALDSKKVDFLVQQYIVESKGVDIRAFVIDGIVVAAMKRIAAGDEFRANINQGGHGEPLQLNALETEIALKAAKAMHLQIAGVDMILSNKGPLVIEVNAFPGMEGIEKATGIDIADKFIDLIEKNVGKKRKKDKIGA